MVKHETVNIPVLIEIKAPQSKYQISVGNIVLYVTQRDIKFIPEINFAMDRTI